MRISKDPGIGVLLGIGTGVFVVTVVWFSGLIAPDTERKAIDKLKTGGTLVSRITTRVTESDTFKSLQAFNSQESVLSALEVDKWQRQASALGIRNPNIQSISLVPRQQFSSTTQVQGKRTVKIQCTIVSIDQEKLVVEMEAWVDGEIAHAESSYIVGPLTPGKMFDLLKHSRISGVSALRLAILSRPENDRLIIAMDGLTPPNKVS